MKPKSTFHSLPLLVAFSCLALPAQAAVTISSLGADTTNAATWRSTSVTKNSTFDVDGDNAYGTAGYAIIKYSDPQSPPGYSLTASDWVTDLPSFVSLTASTGNRWVHPVYPDIDDPTQPIASTVGNLTTLGISYNSSTVTFTINSAQDFVFSVLSSHDLSGPGTLTVTGPGGATANLVNTSSTVGMYFFEMKGFQAGDTFTLAATASGATAGKFTAVAFDVIPEPSVALLGGLGLLALLRRRR